MLDPDADEVLLGLLARDAEPPPYHRQPHRRWAAPPRHGMSHDDGWFDEVETGWWRVVGRAEQREIEKGTRALELERQARAREWHASRYETAPPPVDYFAENVRATGQLMPDWLIEDMRRNGELWPPT